MLRSCPLLQYWACFACEGFLALLEHIFLYPVHLRKFWFTHRNPSNNAVPFLLVSISNCHSTLNILPEDSRTATLMCGHPLPHSKQGDIVRGKRCYLHRRETAFKGVGRGMYDPPDLQFRSLKSRVAGYKKSMYQVHGVCALETKHQPAVLCFGQQQCVEESLLHNFSHFVHRHTCTDTA